MAKKETKNEIAEEEITKEVMEAFEIKAGEYNSEEELLVGLKAIRVDGATGEWIIKEYEGLKSSKDPITGMTFQSDIPYTLYRNLTVAMVRKSKQKAYAIKRADEEFEKNLSIEETK